MTMPHADADTTKLLAGRTPAIWAVLVAIGLAAGYLSGLFGVGGGVLIVPALVAFAHFDMRRAAGTSLAAIVPTSLVGILSYGSRGSVDWLTALVLTLGAIGGAQVGSRLLNRLPRHVVRWLFIAFLAVVIVSLVVVVTPREAVIELGPLQVVGLVVLGFGTGILSGLLGVGGGVIIVPMLILLFGAGDLIAKGTSLVMIVPTAVSGTIANARRHNVDLPAAVAVGLAACLTTTLGAMTAAAIAPIVGNLLFGAFLVVIALRLIRTAVRERG